MPLTRNSAIGLALALLGAAALVWSLLGKPDPFPGGDAIWADFPDTPTILRFDRDVRMGGVNVGTVGRIERRGDRAHVELRLNDDVLRAVRADATAELRPHTLFDGNAFVELHPGSLTAPAIAEGATIPRQRTRTYVSLDKALRVFDLRTRRALPQLAASVREVLDAPTRGALRRTVRRAPALLAPLRAWTRAAQGPSRRELTGAIRGFARTADAVADAEHDLGPALRTTATTSRALRGGDALGPAVAALPSALRAAHTGGEALRATLADLRPLAQDLVPAAGGLAPTLRQLRPVLDRASRVLPRALPLADALAGALRSTRRAAGPAGRLLRALQPTLEVARDDLIPFLNAKAPSGATIAESLAATSASAAGTLAPVKTLAEGRANRAGPGHGFYMSANFVTSTQLGCAQVPAAVVDILRKLELCAP